jgi:hypothetical protein
MCKPKKDSESHRLWTMDYGLLPAIPPPLQKFLYIEASKNMHVKKLPATLLQRLVILFSLFLLTVSATSDHSFQAKNLADPSIEGRWDITIDADGKKWPSWLEITHSGIKTLVGHFVGVTGSARPISRIDYKDGKFSFSIPPQWEEGSDLKVEGKPDGDKMSGTMVFPDGKTYSWTAQSNRTEMGHAD